ncbi:DedA family protein [Candidatus Bipolaricaulota bacterium]|nr:DedA family protein [Candidatus Bipolaricaulota bacterium]
MHAIIAAIVSIVNSMGYGGIVAAMFLESSFFPFPSELVLPPAGYLASQGKMELWIVVLLGIIGSLLGSLFNYWISLRLGRPLILRYGKYIGLTERAYDRAEGAFRRHGEISTFVGRLIPGLRQYISLPAGLARMPIGRFILFTGLGAGIWASVLALLGYVIGNNQEAIGHSLHRITIYTAVGIVILVIGYVVWYRRRK